MSVDFSPTQFAYPLPILRLHRLLERSQWWSATRLRRFQFQRLRALMRHCRRHVPYYGPQLQRLGLRVRDLRGPADLARLPLLDKDRLRSDQGRAELVARNARRYGPRTCRTSGTSGRPLSFLLDRPARVLEFCYYWRYWSWGGYRLGAPFAEFSLHHFLDAAPGRIADRSRLTNRLILNPAGLSDTTLSAYLAHLRRHGARFLKGTPSVLYAFALLLQATGGPGPDFRCLFTTGEKLHQRQRRLLEEVLGCRVLDSYGQMERTVGVSQCEHGTYHIHPEYGIVELLQRPGLTDAAGGTLCQVVGSGLHNRAMPLVRYQTGDLIAPAPDQTPCPCGRDFPIVREVVGREQDIIITPDRRLVANVFIVFNLVPGIAWYRLLQPDQDRVVVELVLTTEARGSDAGVQVEQRLRRILGPRMAIQIQLLDRPPQQQGPKHKQVVSDLDVRLYL